MSGKLRVILDTNAVVSLLAGNRDLALMLEQADYIGISIVTYLEFLAFDGLSDADRDCFAAFCKLVHVVPLSLNDSGLLEQALELRSRYRLKLPDAIIGATAIINKSVLITNDSHFSNIPALAIRGC
jgi:predicted nucleic acid-binding protein